MKRLLFILVLFTIVSCGGGSNNNSSTGLDDVTTVKGDSSIAFKANFESMEGEAFWTLEIFDENENSLGICEFEKRQKIDKKPVYFKNKSGDPICTSVQIDPSSTVDNLKVFNDFSLVKFCLVDNGVKKCGEVRK